MAHTKYFIAEQAQKILASNGKNIGIQELMVYVNNAFGSVVKRSWYQNKEDGIAEINGQFVYTFKNQTVSEDSDLGIYYADLPSSYIDLPHELGVQMVYPSSSNTKGIKPGQDRPFVRVPNGFSSLTRDLDVGGMEGRKVFYVENDRIYFPMMVAADKVTTVNMRLAVALEGIDDDTNINLSPDVVNEIVQLTVSLFIGE